MVKSVLFLGGSHSQIPPLQYARAQGHRVILCDYLPDNPGQAYADEFFQISTTDHDAVLRIALECRIDGIVAYASDPAAPTAAYVGNKMGLPSNPFDAVLTLCRKDSFRPFLKKNGFNVPASTSVETIEEAMDASQELTFPLFVKPVDLSGSKGVTRIEEISKLPAAFAHAMSYSRAKRVVIEEEIVRSGYQVAGDGFVVDRQLKFRCWANEHFDPLCNGLVPIGESFPTVLDPALQDKVHSETQRLLDAVGICMGALNFDYVITKDGELYFLEIGPRNGGCLIPEVTRYATGVDMIKATVDIALGERCPEIAMAPVIGFWSSYIVHALEDGLFEELSVSEEFKEKIVELELYVKPGDRVSKYIGSNNTVGSAILKFESRAEMLGAMDGMEEHIQVIVR